MTNKDEPRNPMTTDQAKAFRRKLLTWYRKHRRDLPWRAMNDRPVNPYHVLLSEAMLQQTQVATVIPYFHRFTEAFPTVQALADADEQEVLTLWQGLGYYRRARNLHAAAKVIVNEHAGQVPATVAVLLGLPGVGRYTAGAIASIAHGTQAAVVDGNVERVFARLFHLTDPINAPATKKYVWSIADTLVPKSNPGDYNQAVMELGATICTPKLPKCFVCPVREHCRAISETNPETLPIKLAKKKPKDVTHVVIAAERNGKYLFEQRPAEGLWSNMWQLPTWEEPPNQQSPATLAIWFKERFGILLEQVYQSTYFTHQTTHRTIQFEVFHASVAQGRLKAKTGVWHRLDSLKDMPLSNPQIKIAEHIGLDT
ncbi:MAG: A/G-specific adenine glycosylase [Phycisphaeraceae bacterium]